MKSSLLISVVLASAVLVFGYPLDTSTYEGGSYEEYLKQMQLEQHSIFNDINEPWQSVNNENTVAIIDTVAESKQDEESSHNVEAEVNEEGYHRVVPVVPFRSAEEHVASAREQEVTSSIPEVQSTTTTAHPFDEGSSAKPTERFIGSYEILAIVNPPPIFVVDEGSESVSSGTSEVSEEGSGIESQPEVDNDNQQTGVTTAPNGSSTSPNPVSLFTLPTEASVAEETPDVTEQVDTTTADELITTADELTTNIDISFQPQ